MAAGGPGLAGVLVLSRVAEGHRDGPGTATTLQQPTEVCSVRALERRHRAAMKIHVKVSQARKPK